MKLTAAILVRQQGGDYDGGMWRERAVASVHPVGADRRGRPTIMAGQLLTREGLREITKALGNGQGMHFLDGRVLAVGNEGVMWWRPPGMRRVWFKTNADEDGIGERSGVVPLPGLVFFAEEGAQKRWYVHAVKGGERPTKDTPLYRAGFYNVWADAKICTGNVELPESASPESIEGYESAFLDSRFTHANVKAKRDLTRYRGGAGALWKSLLDGRRRQFPESSLVPAGMTVGQWMARLAGG